MIKSVQKSTETIFDLSLKILAKFLNESKFEETLKQKSLFRIDQDHKEEKKIIQNYEFKRDIDLFVK